MFMIFLVLDQPDQLDAVLGAWSAVGIRGVTILESTGMYRKQLKHVPMRYLYGCPSPEEEGNFTLLAIVAQEETVHSCLRATEKLIGDLDAPNTGVFASWPLTTVKGLPPTPPTQGE